VVKLVLTWDIQDGKTAEYVEFTVSEFFPALGRLGLQITDTWGTLVGNGPQILIAGTLPSLQEAQALLASREYQALLERLAEYIEHYTWKITDERGGRLRF
jgi:hypothetical protein